MSTWFDQQRESWKDEPASQPEPEQPSWFDQQRRTWEEERREESRYVTPPLDEGYSPPIEIGGRTGRINFNKPPRESEMGGRGFYEFETDDGDTWGMQLEKNLQGGRWEQAEHAAEDYETYKQTDLVDLQDELSEKWQGPEGPSIARTITNAVAEGVPFEEVQRRLQPYNTHRQISAGRGPEGAPPTPSAQDDGRTAAESITPPDMTEGSRAAFARADALNDELAVLSTPDDQNFIVTGMKSLFAGLDNLSRGSVASLEQYVGDVIRGRKPAMTMEEAERLAELREQGGLRTGPTTIGAREPTTREKVGKAIQYRGEDIAADVKRVREGVLAPPEHIRKSVWENPDLLADPHWWANTVGSAGSSIVGFGVPAMGAAKVTSMAMRLASWGKAGSGIVQGAGLAGATVFEAAAEGGFAYQEALDNGATPEEAAEIAAKVSQENLALIGATNVVGMGLPRAVTRRGRRAQDIGAGAIEVGQELGQEEIATRNLGVDMENKSETAITAAIMGPMQSLIFGRYTRQPAQFKEYADQLREEGYSDEQIADSAVEAGIDPELFVEEDKVTDEQRLRHQANEEARRAPPEPSEVVAEPEAPPEPVAPPVEAVDPLAEARGRIETQLEATPSEMSEDELLALDTDLGAVLQDEDNPDLEQFHGEVQAEIEKRAEAEAEEVAETPPPAAEKPAAEKPPEEIVQEAKDRSGQIQRFVDAFEADMPSKDAMRIMKAALGETDGALALNEAKVEGIDALRERLDVRGDAKKLRTALDEYEARKAKPKKAKPVPKDPIKAAEQRANAFQTRLIEEGPAGAPWDIFTNEELEAEIRDLDTVIPTLEDADKKSRWEAARRMTASALEHRGEAPTRMQVEATGDDSFKVVDSQTGKTVRETVRGTRAKAEAVASNIERRTTEQEEKAPTRVPPPKAAAGAKEIGVNAEGDTLYEDEKGVRFKLEGGVKITEPVKMVPTREGVQVSTEGRSEEWEPRGGGPLVVSGSTPTARYSEERVTSGATVGGLKVINASISDIPNQASIEASLTDYEVMPGVRRIPMSEFEGGVGGKGYSVTEEKRIKDLVDEIGARKEITPLIVVEDKDGLYILEGGHRADALARLGVTEFPAMVVRDLESLQEREVDTEAAPAEAKGEGTRGGREQDTDALEGVSADVGGTTPEGRPTPAGAVGTRGAGGPVEGRPDAAGPGLVSGGRAGQADVAAPGRGDRAGGDRTRTNSTPGSPANYRITDADDLGGGGAAAKRDNNFAALDLLKTLEREGRLATPAEQAVLVQYVGWGHTALANITDVRKIDDPKIGRYVKRLKELLTESEFEGARASILNAHYTSPTVINGMYQALERLGFTGGRILEPGTGIGNFIGLQPDAMAQRSQWTGVEMDPLTARIAKQLYQGATIHNTPLQQSGLVNDSFDAAIGNPPFSEIGVVDKVSGLPQGVTQSLHDYFFAKALQKLRPGGVMAFVTSHFTMDKKSTNIRTYLDARADFLGAIRLPNNAFRQNAGTDVTTDIIFLQKRPEGAKRNPVAPFKDTSLVKREDKHGIKGEIRVNNYFLDHPEMVVGTITGAGKMRGPGIELTVEPPSGRLDEALAKRIELLPQSRYEPMTEAQIAAEAELVKPVEVDADVRARIPESSYYKAANGDILERKGEGFFKAKFANEGRRRRVDGLLGIDTAVRELLTLENDPNANTAAMKKARVRLNALYNKFTKKNGPINSRANQIAIGMDSLMGPNVMALEDYDTNTKKATKAAIFSKRVIEPVKVPTSADTPQSALFISLSQRGRVDMPYMAQLTGSTEDQLYADLAGTVFKTPDGIYETADEYLSGNVKNKLFDAQEHVKQDPSFAANVTALEAVQPKDVPPSKIKDGLSLGANWVPQKVYSDFASELFDGDVEVRYIPANASYAVRASPEATRSVANSVSWSVQSDMGDGGGVDGLAILDKTINQKGIIVRWRDRRTGESGVDEKATAQAKGKQELIEAKFRTWLFQDSARGEEMVRRWNDQFNAIVDFTADGSHLEMPGMAMLTPSKPRNQQLRPHQQNAIWRTLSRGSTLLGHVVGSGKTFTMIGTAMEWRRLGMARKPMMVVPNHLVYQIAADFKRMYPQAKLLVATKKTFSAKNRRRLVNRIAQGEWDTVIISHSQFKFLPVKDETYLTFLREQVAILERTEAELEAEDKGSKSAKELEKARQRLQQKIEDRETAAKNRVDPVYPFEDLGVDGLLVDEAHAFKNLWFPTKQTRTAGIPNSDSQRAFDMYLKARHIQQGSNNRTLVFSTGTPISNSMAEFYTMQRYMQPDALVAAGLDHFDAWSAQFGKVRSAVEMTVSGTYKVKDRFAEFQNLKALTRMFRQNADIILAEDINLPVPKVKGNAMQSVEVPVSPEYLALVDELAKRAANLGSVDPKDDNMLKITSEGRKATLDLRLLGLSQEGDATKLNAAAEKVEGLYRRWDKQKGTQLIFADIGTPRTKTGEKGEAKALGVTIAKDDVGAGEIEDAVGGEAFVDESTTGDFSFYEELRDELIRRGVKAEHIAFIHDANTEKRKESLFEDMNEGRIRVLLGSTEKMGAGMNVQRRLVALHHLDVPWRPADIEQRNGRIIRQGNMFQESDPNFEVEIYNYVGSGAMFDEFMWGMQTTKLKNVKAAMTGEVDRIEDVDSFQLNPQQMQALASQNPLMFEKLELGTRLRSLEAEEAAVLDETFFLDRKIHQLPDTIARNKTRIATLAALKDQARDPKTQPFAGELDGKTYDEPGKFGEAMLAKLQKTVKGTRAGIEAPKKESDLAKQHRQQQEDRQTERFDLGTVNGNVAITAYDAGKREGGKFVNNERVTWNDQHYGISARIESVDPPHVVESGFWREVDIEGNAGNLTRQVQLFVSDVQGRIDNAEKNQAQSKTELEQAKAARAKVGDFTKADELKAARARMVEIDTELSKVEDDTPTQEEKEPTDTRLEMPARRGPEETGGRRVTRESVKPPGPGKQMTRGQLVDYVAKALGRLPIREGRTRGARGVYDVPTGTVRLDLRTDLEALAHEVGHHLDEILFKGSSSRRSEWADELKSLGRETAPPKASAKRIRQEGAAQFLMLLWTKPSVAQQTAPIYYEAVMKQLSDPKNAEVAEVIYLVQSQMTGLLNADLADQALNMVDSTGQEPKSMTLTQRIERDWVNELAPLKWMVEELGGGKAPENVLDDGFRMAELARSAASKAYGFIEISGVTVSGEEGITTLAGSLKDALAPLSKLTPRNNTGKDIHHEFGVYLVARHMPETLARGVKSTMTIEQANAYVEKYGRPEFEEAAQKVNAFNDAMLDYAIDGGVMTQESADHMRAAYGMYVPLVRVAAEVEAEMTGGVGGVAKRIASRAKPRQLKMRIGGGGDYVNPIESIVRNTHIMVDTVENNRAMQALVRQAEATGEKGGSFLKRVPNPKMATKFDLGQLNQRIKSSLEDRGFTELPDDLDFTGEAVTVFTPMHFATGRGGLISVMENGQRTWFEVNEPALYEAITTLGARTPEILVNLFEFPARVLRSAATMTLEFAARNPARDTWEAYVFSKYGFRLVYDTMRGFFSMMNRTDDYKAFVSSLAGGHSLVSTDRNLIRESMRKWGLQEPTGGKAMKMGKTVALTGVDYMRALSEAMETASRLGEFMRGIEKEGRTAEGMARAAHSAAEVTVNFRRAGRYAKQVNRYAAFFNAQLQGSMVRPYEVFLKDRDGLKLSKRGRDATIRATMSITLPTLLLAYINWDDEEYKNLPRWEKDAYWHIPLRLPGGDDRGHDWWRIPKPWTMGWAFGNTFDGAIQWMRQEDEVRTKEGLRRIFGEKDDYQEYLYSLLPNFLVAVVEVGANYSTFFHRNIVSPFKRELDAELQANRWTSDTARLIARYTGVPAAYIDHLNQNIFAGMGRYATESLDKLVGPLFDMPKKPSVWGLHGVPGLRAFYRRAVTGANGEYISQFYEKYDEMQGLRSSIKVYEESGQTTRAERMRRENRELLDNYRRMQDARNAMSKHTKELNRLFSTPREVMSAQEKDERATRVYQKMIDTARKAFGARPIYND